MPPASIEAVSGEHSRPDEEPALVASVVVTTFRRQAMLAELLDALCPQVKSKPVEVIIVDNCPSASAHEIVEARQASFLRYEHEMRSGVVHARNRGVAAALGTYVIFLDDDELPGTGWLDAWLTQADGITDVSFGRIVPRLLAACPAGMNQLVEQSFRREMNTSTNADISPRWPYLGTGNAMFHKHRCFDSSAPFDARFNARGGEDVWLIRGLVTRGYRLIWNHDAVVEELVPSDRMMVAFLAQRRFNQGQLRCILSFGEGGYAGVLGVSIWMLAGAVQSLWNGTAAALASIFAPQHAAAFQCRASGGLGKLLWWHRSRVNVYGSH